MDTVRISKRLGAKNAYIIYRRSDVEMPAREEEIHHAKEEGIEFILLSNPLEFIGDERGWLKSVKIQKWNLVNPILPEEEDQFRFKARNIFSRLIWL